MSPRVNWQQPLIQVKWNIFKFWLLLASPRATLPGLSLLTVHFNSKYQFGSRNSKNAKKLIYGVASLTSYYTFFFPLQTLYHRKHRKESTLTQQK